MQDLKLVQSNLFESIQMFNFDKKRYFIIFLNETYKWLKVKLLNQKSNAKMIFCKYYKQKKRQFERKLKIFRIDNDTEFFDIIKVCIENDIYY